MGWSYSRAAGAKILSFLGYEELSKKRLLTVDFGVFFGGLLSCVIRDVSSIYFILVNYLSEITKNHKPRKSRMLVVVPEWFGNTPTTCFGNKTTTKSEILFF